MVNILVLDIVGWFKNDFKQKLETIQSGMQ